MGYITNYELTVDTTDSETLDKIRESFVEVASYYMEELYGIKWYDNHDDMIKLSILYPNVLFTLTGDGEDLDDLWRTYYKNGRYQEAEVELVYSDFNEKELK